MSVTLGVAASAHVEVVAPVVAPTFVQAATAPLASAFSVSVTFAAGVQTGDVVYFYCCHGTTGMTISAMPAGWVNVLGGVATVQGGQNAACGIYHVVTAGENGQTTFATASMFTSGITGNVTAVVLRGVKTSTPVDGAGSTFSGTVVTPHVLAAITGTGGALGDNSLVVRGVAKDGTGSYTTPAGHTMRQTSNSTSAAWLGTRDAATVASTDVAAVNITPSASDEFCSISVAFSGI